MRFGAIAIAVVTLAAPGSAVAAAPHAVEVMVVGRSGVLRPAATVRARATRVQVGRERCAVPANSPLAALAASGVSFRMRDYGCGAGSLFVERIRNERASAVNGWVYKIGQRAPSVSAGSPRVRAGTRILWFWCRQGPRGCQRTLDVTPSAARVAPGAPVTFTVRGYDDRGHGTPVTGATVRFAGARLVTGPDGTVTTTAPATPGRQQASAQARGVVPSFPAGVLVG